MTPAFGYRLIADELPARGITAGENKVARLCPSSGSGQTSPRSAACPGRPDRTWLTDITGHPTGEGKLYLCAFKDVYSGRIVGYSMGSRMTAGLAVSALRNAIALREPAGTVVVHPDRGSQFRSAAFAKTLTGHGLTGSMGRVGACGDKPRWNRSSRCCKNRSGPAALVTREQLRQAIITWIERTYHRRRRQRRLGLLTPIEYETINQAAHAA